MSVLYPTINWTWISCRDKNRHGSIAGFLLFFTCVGESDRVPWRWVQLATWQAVLSTEWAWEPFFAEMLAILCLWNRSAQPAAPGSPGGTRRGLRGRLKPALDRACSPDHECNRAVATPCELQKGGLGA